MFNSDQVCLVSDIQPAFNCFTIDLNIDSYFALTPPMGDNCRIARTLPAAVFGRQWPLASAASSNITSGCYGASLGRSTLVGFGSKNGHRTTAEIYAASILCPYHELVKFLSGLNPNNFLSFHHNNKWTEYSSCLKFVFLVPLKTDALRLGPSVAV